jgi:RNase P/RNase MRP subunit p30
MQIISELTFEKARKKISEVKSKNKKIIFAGDDDELNRKILEKLKIDILLITLTGKKDFQKQRNSGFNQVLAKAANKSQVTIGINLDELIYEKGKKKSELLGRIMQNIKLCNKNKLKMQFISERNTRNIYDIKALGSVLGMPTWMTSNLENIYITPDASKVGN